MQSSIEAPISHDQSAKLIEDIKSKKWWQGSLISSNDLNAITSLGHKEVAWWVIASQTCNLYNKDFKKIPVFEVVAANEIDKCSPDKIRGDHPRVLHLEASSKDGVIALEIDIQKRAWLSREMLGMLAAPIYQIRDTDKNQDEFQKKQWLDNFIGWMSRSYNRIALPDYFNEALDNSRLKEVFEKKLTKHANNLYGVYLLLGPDSDDEWNDVLGEMPPPYVLGITLVVFSDVDPEEIKNKLVGQLFEDKIKDPDNSLEKITRADLAKRYGIRITSQDVNAVSMEEITLSELRSLIRYSLVDHFSDSSMATS